MKSTTSEYEMQYLEASINLLENYLLSKEIYQPIGIRAEEGQPPYPPLTLGWLLLARIKARAVSTNSVQLEKLDRVCKKLEDIHRRWRSAWRQKAQAEYRSRIKLWRDFLEEYRENPTDNKNRYAFEVNRRVLLHLLQQEADFLSPADHEALSGLDRILREYFQAGSFIWSEEWIRAFPKMEYWYLYGSLR